MPFAPINGIELYYEVHGDGAQAVVFAHGAAGNHLSWWQQVPAFSREFTCITFDHRAFGVSHNAPGGPGMRAHVEDLQGLLDHLGIQAAHLVAQSMGGFTCLVFAARYPERTISLVVADTPGGLNDPVLLEMRREQRQAGSVPTEPATRAISQGFRERHPEMAHLYRLIAGLNPPRPEDFAEAMARGEGPTPQQVAQAGVPTLQ